MRTAVLRAATDSLAGVLVDKRPTIQLVISKSWPSVDQYAIKTWLCVDLPLADYLLRINKINNERPS